MSLDDDVKKAAANRLTTTERERTVSVPGGDAHYYELTPDIDVFSWSPEPPGTKDAKVTQVHLHIGGKSGNVLVLRLKSAEIVDALGEALRRHREDVWPSDKSFKPSELDTILGILNKMTDSERELFFKMLPREFCLHCGRKQKKGELPCQCWNDE